MSWSTKPTRWWPTARRCCGGATARVGAGWSRIFLGRRRGRTQCADHAAGGSTGRSPGSIPTGPTTRRGQSAPRTCPARLPRNGPNGFRPMHCGCRWRSIPVMKSARCSWRANSPGPMASVTSFRNWPMASPMPGPDFSVAAGVRCWTPDLGRAAVRQVRHRGGHRRRPVVADHAVGARARRSGAVQADHRARAVRGRRRSFHGRTQCAGAGGPGPCSNSIPGRSRTSSTSPARPLRWRKPNTAKAAQEALFDDKSRAKLAVLKGRTEQASRRRHLRPGRCSIASTSPPAAAGFRAVR